MKVIYKCAAILTAAILSVQFPCAAFADAEHGGDNDSPKFKMGRIIFTDNGYGYEKEGLEKSEIADGDLVDTDDGVSPYAQKATASLPAKYDPRSKNSLTTIKISSRQALAGRLRHFPALRAILFKRVLKIKTCSFLCRALPFLHMLTADLTSQYGIAAERGWIRHLQWRLIGDFAMRNMSLSCPTERKPLSYLRRKRAFVNISLITLPLSQADETPLKTR